MTTPSIPPEPVIATDELGWQHAMHPDAAEKVRKSRIEVEKAWTDLSASVDITYPLSSPEDADMVVSQLMSRLSRRQLMQMVCSFGFPPALRASFWFSLFGAQEMEQATDGSDIYTLLVSAASGKRIGGESFELSARTMRQIDVDLPRTFAEHQLFQWKRPEDDEEGGGGGEGDGEGEEDGLPICCRRNAWLAALRRVLRAYVLLNPRVGYVQGMNFVCAFLLLITGRDECRTIFLLHGLVTRILPGVFASGMPTVRVAGEVFGMLVEERFPTIAENLRLGGMEASLLLPRWLLCGFLSAVPAETVARIWDMLGVVCAARVEAEKRDDAEESCVDGDTQVASVEEGQGIRAVLQVSLGLVAGVEEAISDAVRTGLAPMLTEAEAWENKRRSSSLSWEEAVLNARERLTTLARDLGDAAGMAAAAQVAQRAGSDVFDATRLLRRSTTKPCFIGIEEMDRLWQCAWSKTRDLAPTPDAIRIPISEPIPPSPSTLASLLKSLPSPAPPSSSPFPSRLRSPLIPKHMPTSSPTPSSPSSPFRHRHADRLALRRAALLRSPPLPTKTTTTTTTTSPSLSPPVRPQDFVAPDLGLAKSSMPLASLPLFDSPAISPSAPLLGVSPSRVKEHSRSLRSTPHPKTPSARTLPSTPSVAHPLASPTSAHLLAHPAIEPTTGKRRVALLSGPWHMGTVAPFSFTSRILFVRATIPVPTPPSTPTPPTLPLDLFEHHPPSSPHRIPPPPPPPPLPSRSSSLSSSKPKSTRPRSSSFSIRTLLASPTSSSSTMQSPPLHQRGKQRKSRRQHRPRDWTSALPPPDAARGVEGGDENSPLPYTPPTTSQRPEKPTILSPIQAIFSPGSRFGPRTGVGEIKRIREVPMTPLSASSQKL